MSRSMLAGHPVQTKTETLRIEPSHLFFVDLEAGGRQMVPHFQASTLAEVPSSAGYNELSQ